MTERIEKAVDLDAECDSCGAQGAVEGECPEGKRPCGHHCNHSWIQDECCWCGQEFGEQDC